MGFKMPFQNLLPPLTTEEFAALKADIERNGVRDPIIVDEVDNILDGHHRYKIDQLAPSRIISGMTEEEKQAFVIRTNSTRRNLSPEQKREVRKKLKILALTLRRKNPQQWTQDALGKLLGVDQATISLWVEDAMHNMNSHNVHTPDARVKIPPVHYPVIVQRLGQGESQEQVAADYGVNQSTISRLIEKAQAVSKNNEPVHGESSVVTTIEELINQGKKFPCIYADPPWKYSNQATRAATKNHYPTMTVEEIAALRVCEVAADNAHLHMWTTAGFLPESFRIIESWGFTYKSYFVWVKDKIGIGNYWRKSTELLLLGVRGSLPFRDKSLKDWIHVKRTRHSAKPEKIRRLIMRGSPGPYLELFARHEVDEWTTLGNQINTEFMGQELD